MSQEKFRCTGHCCRGFALEESYSDLQLDYTAWQKDPKTSKIPQIEIIAPMVIPLKASPAHREYVYTCKNLDRSGNCTIYPTRPQICRDFPDLHGCHFWKCTSDQSVYRGMGLIAKIRTRWKWLRGLGNRRD